MSLKGKRIRKAYENVDENKIYTLSDALKVIKSCVTTKFDETIEIAINLNLDTRKSNQHLRGVLQLPHGTGKSVIVAVFARGDKVEQAKIAGADIVGSEDLADKIKKGDIQFDRCIATTDMMGIVGQLGKILGPKGLMPNPKLGTVTDDIEKAVKAVKGGQIEYRAEKAGIVHAGVGKSSFSDNALIDNIKSFVEVINKARPSGIKGVYLKKVHLSSTMGPSVKVNLADLQNL